MFSIMKTLNNTTDKNSATKIMAINIAANLKSPKSAIFLTNDKEFVESINDRNVI